MTVDRRPVGRVARVIVTMLIFAVVGPPVGGLTFLGLAVLAETAGPSHLIRSLGVVVVMGYAFGLIPAALAGLLIGLQIAARGRLPWATILIVGVSVGILTGVLLGLMRGPEQIQGYVGLVFWMIMVCTVPTVVCSLIVRRMLWRATDSGRESVT